MVKGLLISSPDLAGRKVVLKGSEQGVSALVSGMTSKYPTAH